MTVWPVKEVMMGHQIKITVGETNIKATLNETETAAGILDILPVTASFNLWGDEIYFSIPLAMEEAEDAREIVDVGDIAYWPQGQALCIFLGKTPVSRGDEPRAISPVNVAGRVEAEGVPVLLNAVRQQNSITIRR